MSPSADIAVFEYNGMMVAEPWMRFWACSNEHVMLDGRMPRRWLLSCRDPTGVHVH